MIKLRYHKKMLSWWKKIPSIYCPAIQINTSLLRRAQSSRVRIYCLSPSPEAEVVAVKLSTYSYVYLPFSSNHSNHSTRTRPIALYQTRMYTLPFLSDSDVRCKRSFSGHFDFSLICTRVKAIMMPVLVYFRACSYPHKNLVHSMIDKL